MRREPIKDAFDDLYLTRFVSESNAIENITRVPTPEELRAHQKLFKLKRIQIHQVVDFVKTIQPDAVLRVIPGCNVYVGNHVPPPGGEAIRYELKNILDQANSGDVHPYDVHCQYETIHPFSDGNGRSGRAVWAWQMLNQRWEGWGIDLKFLRAFYYQTLSKYREPNATTKTDKSKTNKT